MINNKRESIEGTRNVIQRGSAGNLTEALLVTAGSKIYNLAGFIGTVFNEIYHYTDGSTHLCNHPVIKDILKNARDRAWKGRQNFSRNKNLTQEGTRRMAAVLKLYKYYFEYAEYEELWEIELRTTATYDAQCAHNPSQKKKT